MKIAELTVHGGKERVTGIYEEFDFLREMLCLPEHRAEAEALVERIINGETVEYDGSRYRIASEQDEERFAKAELAADAFAKGSPVAREVLGDILSEDG